MCFVNETFPIPAEVHFLICNFLGLVDDFGGLSLGKRLAVRQRVSQPRQREDGLIGAFRPVRGDFELLEDQVDFLIEGLLLFPIVP